MRVFSVTDVGKTRKVNQDYIYTSEQPIGNLPNVFVVADGMGGHNGGGTASSYGVQMLLESIRLDNGFNPVKILKRAVNAANTQVLEKAGSDAGLKGMGTTMVVTTIVGHYAYVANVGDSRMYIMNRNLEQITRDHSLVEEMIRMGEIDREKARTHPDKNIITRAVGANSQIDVDFFEVKLNPESKIVMCSDGVSNMVADEQMHKLLARYGPEENPAQLLADLANENGGKDNIAVIVVEPCVKEVRGC